MYHESRGQDNQFVGKVVGPQEFGGCKVCDRVEAYWKVCKAGKARKGVGTCRLEHELEESDGVHPYAENFQGESLADSETEGGKGRDNHGKRYCRDGIELENAEGDSHDGAVGNGVEDLGYQEFFPEFPADEIPVEKGVLEKESECKNQFTEEDVAFSADGERKNRHSQSGEGCHEQSELQNVDEKASLGGALSEKGENQCRHAEIGERTENGIVALQNSERSEFDNSEIIGDKILYNNRDTLDEDIDQRDENADFDVPKCLQRAIK